MVNNELLSSASSEQPLAVTDGENVLCVPGGNVKNIAPCNREEADSRIFVHVSDDFLQGFHKILVRTVVVLTVAAVQQIGRIDLWIAFGTGKDFRYIPAHEICSSLGPRTSLTLPVFHDTVCDTVFQFAQVGKQTA